MNCPNCGAPFEPDTAGRCSYCGQVVSGVAMLSGSAAGGLIAQLTSLGVPFVLRGAVLLVMFAVAFRMMHDVGFTPAKGGRPLAEMRRITAASIDYGWRVPAVKWLMVEALFVGGVGFYAFYALQPYLLELYGDPNAYGIAGLPTDPRVAAGLPTQLITGFSDLGRQATNPQWQYPTVFNPKINYTWLQGRHSLKSGYEFQHIQTEVQDVNPLYGRDQYAGNFSKPVPTLPAKRMPPAVFPASS